MKSNEPANSKAIFNHLFDQMKLLKAGVVTTEEAKAQANLAKQANNVLKYELDRATFLAKYPEQELRNIED